MGSRIPAEVLDRLSAVPLFADCTKSQLRQIASLGVDVAVQAGRSLTQQGRPGSEFFLVRSGTARCVVDGTEVARFGPGDFFGEIALLASEPRNATVTTVDDMTVRVFDRREFASLLDDAPEIARKLLSALAKRRQPTYRD